MTVSSSSIDKNSGYCHIIVEPQQQQASTDHPSSSVLHLTTSPTIHPSDGSSSSGVHISWPSVMIANPQTLISFGGGPKETLIQAPTDFMHHHPHVFTISTEQDLVQEPPQLPIAAQSEKHHQQELLMEFMPIPSSPVATPDSNHFSDGSGNYSNYGYSDDSNNPLTNMVYHHNTHQLQSSQVLWESGDEHQQAVIYYDNNSNNANANHAHQHPLIITPLQQQQATPASPAHALVSSTPEWSSWSPPIDKPRLPIVAGDHLTTTTNDESNQATVPKTEKAVIEHQNDYSFQLFDSSASLQTATATLISSNNAALYDTCNRTNTLPGTSITKSDQNSSVHPRLDNNNKDGFHKYDMPSKQLTVASWLRPLLQSYLMATDPLAMGEKTILVLTSKVAQKSYGTEKRFICPPPTVILDGPAWWTSPSTASERPLQSTQKAEATPPKLSVSMSGESDTQEGQIDWFAQSGAMVGQTGFTALPQMNHGSDTGSPSSKSTKNSAFDKAINTADRDWFRLPARDPLAGGKCVLRQLYINDGDEKRKRVECLATISLSNGVTLGTVGSQPIKVISKPSKKRLSMKNTDSWIHHGAMVSLFNRIRSQTVSTKYLAVSTASPSTGLQKFMYPGQISASKPTTSRKKQNDGTCFTTRTGNWDPFVIWLVDTNWVPPSISPSGPSDGSLRLNPDEYIGSCAPTIRNGMPYPPPPAIALKNKTGQPLAIHYNQHVVLQCLTTGLVSPVMIIRKVDRASTVVGGANSKYCAHPEGIHGGEYGDEILGDPVSQLHRVALQIAQNHENNTMTHHSTAPTSNPRDIDMMPRSDRPASYLACVNDIVAMHPSTADRKPIQPADDADAARRASRRRLTSTSSDGPQANYYFGVMNGAFTHHYSTMSIHDGSPRLAKRSRSVCEDGSLVPSPLGPICVSELSAFWSEDVSDSAVWTIVGTDSVKYTLWEPPGVPVSASNDSLNPPSMLPAVFSYSPHKQADQKDREEKGVYISVHGKNLSRDLEVWFGDVQSPQTEYHGCEQIVCEVPSPSDMTQAVGASWKNESVCSVPLLLVKRDGKAVYKTGKHYVIF